MTIFFPDVSNYQAGLTIQPGTVAVVAKATEGTGYQDASFHNFQAQAKAEGSVFSGYHFLHQGGGVAQADFYWNFAGATPCMIDCEPTGSSRPTVGDCLNFMSELKSKGGRVWGVYFPHWYWAEVGGNLAELVANGAVVVSSAYTTYSDSGPGWAAYGGASPAVWQYTDAQSYGGKSVDFNAYRGTVDQFRSLVTGGVTPVPTPTPTPTPGGTVLSDLDVLKIWEYQGGDATGPDDSPDVHQSLLTTRDNSVELLAAVKALAADVAAIKAKVGA